MTEQAFASVWGLSYPDFEFLRRDRATALHALHLLQSSLVCVKTRILPSILRNPDTVARLSPENHRGQSPLIHLHINP
jgi:hypothetical protein